MRQIGVRDEARAVGGVGPCGKELCCATFLRDFEPITVKMAKDQKLSLNPAKLSGVCGRLMCCLIYEHESYARQKAGAPCAAAKAPPPPPEAAEPGDEELTARLSDDLEDAE
jgi:cell fate regulator YaaT (PSP1 superfamily)